MYHAHLDMVGMETTKEVLETGFALLHVTGAAVLAVFVDGSNMALDNHLVTATLQGVADIGTRHGRAVVEVDIVHAAVERHRHQLQRCRAVEFLESAASDTYFADHEAGVTQRSVLHVGLFLFRSAGGEHQRRNSEE